MTNNLTLDVTSATSFVSSLLKHADGREGQVLCFEGGMLKIKQGDSTQPSAQPSTVTETIIRLFDTHVTQPPADDSKKEMVKRTLTVLFNQANSNKTENTKLVNEIVLKLFPTSTTQPLSYKKFYEQLTGTYPKAFVKKYIQQMKQAGWIIPDLDAKDGLSDVMDKSYEEKITTYIDQAYQPLVTALKSDKNFQDLQTILKTFSNSNIKYHIQAQKALQSLEKLNKTNPEYALLTKNLEAALITLSNPQSFDFIDNILESLPSRLGINKDLIATSKETSIQLIANHIGLYCNNIQKLEKTIPDVIKNTKRDLLKVQVDQLLPPGQPKPSNWDENIEKYVSYAEQIDTMCREILPLGIDLWFKNYNPQIRSILSTHSHLNPKSSRLFHNDICAFIYKRHIVQSIRAMVEQKSIPAWPSKQEIETQIAEKIVTKLEKSYTPMANWIDKNQNKIIKLYNQGDDYDYNTGDGTCLYNSLDRISNLIKNPRLDVGAIDMRSSNEGRRSSGALATRNTLQKDVDYFIQVDEYIAKKNLASAKLVSYPSASDAILQAILSGKPHNLISLHGENRGHTVHIFVKNKEIWLFDDNMGIMKFQNNETDIKEISSYLQNMYQSSYTAFSYQSVWAKT